MAVKKYLEAVGIACLLSLINVVEAQILPQIELAALQDIYRAWNETPDLSSKLPGWISFDPANTTEDPCVVDNWGGVYCYIDPNVNFSAKLNRSYYAANVVSLTVSDASIVGTLPSSIWNFSSLVSLTLTENPSLTGPIPHLPANLEGSHESTSIFKSLDLHGNGFSGNISKGIFDYHASFEYLDLSNNHLEGQFPQSYAPFVRSLMVSNNSLSGSISDAISLDWSNLVTADFSRNEYTGHIPNLSRSDVLYTLNMSHNRFVGEINPLAILSTSNSSLTILDFSDNMLTGQIPDFGIWTHLQSLNLSYNGFVAGPFPVWVSSLQSLHMLSLSNTSLTGELNLSFLCAIPGLTIIELDNNSFSGALDVDSLGCSTNIQTIQVRNNQIGKVKFSGRSVSHLNFSIELIGNPYCNSKRTDLRRCLCEQLCYDTPKTDSRSLIIGLAIGGSLVVLTILIASFLLWKSRQEKRYLLLAVHQKFAEFEMKPTLFSYSELEKATRNFHSDMKVGQGAFGAVYKGKLADGSEVAVKQLFSKTQQNMDDFLNEVVLLTSVRHRNLVKLKGCCLRGDRSLLVYEYLNNYDLAETLFDHKGNQLVTWSLRFNICLGVAQGLHYLHAGVDPRILHRDIKASNVLLDHNLHPKIADFGLAMLFPNEHTHITVEQVAGTKGYLAPEYATRGQLSDKVDVFSYGVLALEVLSGRKNIALQAPSSKTYLLDWACELNEEGRLMDLLDPMLPIQNEEEVEVQRVITTALSCVQIAPERRPTMAQVVGMLEGDIEIGEFGMGQVNEDINQTFHSLHGLKKATTTLLTVDEENPMYIPADEESQALHRRERSNSRNLRPKGVELSAVKPR